MSQNMENKRVKQIDVSHHFIREKLESKEICLKYVCSKNQEADIFTKSLSRIHFQELLKKIAFCERDEVLR